MKKIERNENRKSGITLIALVITIVILIILAVVTINAVFGDSGLISYAEKVQDYQANAESSDSEMINQATDYIEDIFNNQKEPAELTDIYWSGYSDGTLAFSSTNTTIEDENRQLVDGPTNIKGEEFTVTFIPEGDAGLDGEYLADTPWFEYRENITSVIFIDEIVPSNVVGWFCGCTNLQEINNIENLNTENVSDFSALFAECNNLLTLDLSSFNTSQATNMKGMFNRCYKLNSLNLTGFDTSNVTDMSAMFGSLNAIQTLDVSELDTSNVTNMSMMFSYCYQLESLDLSGFDTSNVTDMNGMFYMSTGLTSLDLGNNFDTSKVTNMSGMFGATNRGMELTEIKGLENFDTRNVTDMSFMFQNCRQLTSLDLSNFDTSKVTDMSYMFCSCQSINQILVNASTWVTAPTATDMFLDCNVSQVTPVS